MTDETGTTPAPALEMRGITKRYPGVVANSDINLKVRPGEIHALLGENGAGKTTLMNVLYGLGDRRTRARSSWTTKPVRIAGPSDAIARGINMVHQHFMLVPVLTVAENILLGDETMANRVFVDRREAHRRIVELGRRFGFEIDPDVRVGSLSVGWQQRVEILKALYRNARILVLDEPTAVLTPQETDEIFEVLRRLAREGHSIVFISHKLYEVLEIADRITVIRRGKVVGERLPHETNEDDLAELMVGREVQLTVDRGESHPGAAVLRVTGLEAKDDRGHVVVRGVDLEVRAGEILGIAGVAGNGQDELVEAIVGLRRPSAGTVNLDGIDVTGAPARAMNEAGVAYVPADRHRFGLILPFSLADNLVLTSYYRPPYAHGLLRDPDAIERDAAVVDRALRHPGAVGDRRGRARCPAATSRRPSSPASSTATSSCSSSTSRPAASTSEASSSSIARSSRSAMPAPPSCWSPPSSTRCSRCRTGSASCTTVGSSPCVDGRTADKNAVGLLMATGGRGTATAARGPGREPARCFRGAPLAPPAGPGSPSRLARPAGP